MTFFKDKLILVSLVLAALLNIVVWIVMASKFGYSHEPIPLHFNPISGIDFVAPAVRVFQVPAAGLVIFLVNIFLAAIFFRLEKFVSYFLIVGAAAVQIILLIAGIAIVILNK